MNGDVKPPRRLTRSNRNKMIAGVCGGLAEYLNMDPILMFLMPPPDEVTA